MKFESDSKVLCDIRELLRQILDQLRTKTRHVDP